MKTCLWTLVLCLAASNFLLSGCENKPGLLENQASLKKTTVPEGEDRILARVNQTPISARDLDYAISSAFADQKTGERNPEVRKQMLKSLVASRALSQARLLEMTDKELKDLDQEVQAFREKLLVRQYVMGHAPPEPLSQRMMLDYYESHAQAFGADTVKKYEMITSDSPLTPSERDRFMEAMKRVPETGEWNPWVQRMKKEGYSMAYRTGILNKEVLSPELIDATRMLETGKKSVLIFVNDTPYVVRIVHVEQTAPLPFEDVKDKIRQQLTADSLKKSVSGLTEKVLGQADVVYEDQELKNN